MYSVNSFSSLISCYMYLVRLDEQLFQAPSKYFSDKGGSASPIKIDTYAAKLTKIF